MNDTISYTTFNFAEWNNLISHQSIATYPISQCRWRKQCVVLEIKRKPFHFVVVAIYCFRLGSKAWMNFFRVSFGRRIFNIAIEEKKWFSEWFFLSVNKSRKYYIWSFAILHRHNQETKASQKYFKFENHEKNQMTTTERKAKSKYIHILINQSNLTSDIVA